MKYIAKRFLSVFLILSLSIVFLNGANTSEYVLAADSYGIIEDKNPGVFYGEQLKDSGIAYSYELYNLFKEIDTGTEVLEYKFSTPIEMKGENISEVTTQNVEILKNVNNAVQVALDAFVKDYPEIFWLDYSKTVFSQIFSYVYEPDGNVQWYITKIKVTFTTDGSFSASPYEACKAVYDNAYRIIENSDSNSIYHRMKDYHDYLCNSITYTTEGNHVRNIYGGLIDGNGVCEAYAESFKFLCDLSGISCISIMGKAGIPEPDENHLWNYCRMDDGAWYAVDVTWDDQPNLNPSVIYDHFLCGSDNVGEKTKVSLSQSHLEKGDFSNTDIYSFTYPKISTDLYQYDPDRTAVPTAEPTATPTAEPTATPTAEPTATPTAEPTATPTVEPTATPTAEPTATPTAEPTATPTVKPTATPTAQPTSTPTPEPTPTPITSPEPTEVATEVPTPIPTVELTEVPTGKPVDVVLGDVNRDENIDSSDALLILKIASKLYSPDDNENLAADIDKNGNIDAVDALIVLKHAAKLQLIEP